MYTQTSSAVWRVPSSLPIGARIGTLPGGGTDAEQGDPAYYALVNGVSWSRSQVEKMY